MRRKEEQYRQVVELRTQGLSLRDISQRVGVAKSTVSLWVRDVELSPEHAAALAAANPVGTKQGFGQEVWSLQCRRRREEAQARGRALARQGDPLHRTGCMLYWGEGSKSPNAVVFTNSDADMMRLFVRFLRECFGLGDDRMRLSINCFLGNGLGLEEIEDWWCDQLGLPRTCLRTAAVNRPSRSSKAVHKVLLHGTARLTVHSTELAQSIFGAIQEYGGFDREEWLDPGRRRRVAE